MEENPYLSMLKDNIAKWKSLVSKIDRASSELKPGEDVAYRELRDYWKNNDFNAAKCNALLEEMKNYKARHTKGKFLEQLQEFRGLCKGYYTDNTNFEAFKKALGGKQTSPKPLIIRIVEAVCRQL